MDLGLTGKTAIVTGGASNIGKAIVGGFSAEGANVVIADVDQDQAQRLLEQLRGSGDDRALAVKADVTDRGEVEALVSRTVEAFAQIDILVNCAGWTRDALFLDKPVDEFEREIAINLWGPINCIRAVAPLMVEKGYGKIVNIGSDAGRVGEYNEAVYSACKGGVITLSKALARELGRHRINVNAVCPGLTLPENPEDAGANSMWHRDSAQSRFFQNEETLAKVARRYPLKRIGVPRDIVPMVLLMSSDRTSYVTGQVVSVSGGYAM